MVQIAERFSTFTSLLRGCSAHVFCMYEPFNKSANAAQTRDAVVPSELVQTTADNKTTSIPSTPAKSPSFVTKCEHR